MKQAAIKFAANSSPGERSQLSGARLINAIVEKLGTGTGYRQTRPGLKKYSTSLAAFALPWDCGGQRHDRVDCLQRVRGAGFDINGPRLSIRSWGFCPARTW